MPPLLPRGARAAVTVTVSCGAGRVLARCPLQCPTARPCRGPPGSSALSPRGRCRCAAAPAGCAAAGKPRHRRALGGGCAAPWPRGASRCIAERRGTWVAPGVRHRSTPGPLCLCRCISAVPIPCHPQQPNPTRPDPTPAVGQECCLCVRLSTAQHCTALHSTAQHSMRPCRHFPTPGARAVGLWGCGAVGWARCPRDAGTCEGPGDVVLLPLPGLVVLIGRALVVAGQAALTGCAPPRALPHLLPFLAGGVVEPGVPLPPHPLPPAVPWAPWGRAGLWGAAGAGGAAGPPWRRVQGGCVGWGGTRCGVTHLRPRGGPHCCPRAPRSAQRAPSIRSRWGPTERWEWTPTEPPPSPELRTPPRVPPAVPSALSPLCSFVPHPSPLPPPTLQAAE